MFDNLRKLLKAQSATSGEIRAQIEQIEGALPTAKRQLEELRAKRQSILIAGSEKERAAIRVEIMRAEDDVDALDGALVALQGKLEYAEAEERRAALRVKVEAARKASDRGIELVRRYQALASEMVSILAELQVCESVVRESWEPARELDIDKVQVPLRRAATGAEYTEIIGLVALPAVDGCRQFLWPPSDPERKAEIEALQQKLRAVG